MGQPTPKGRGGTARRPKPRAGWRKGHPMYGTSALEDRFAREFLDAAGLEYVRQYEAVGIGRFFDFKVEDGPIIEVNGSYWHGDGRLYEEKDLNGAQRRSIRADEQKKKWADRNGFDVVYIWEKDIEENPEGVMRLLREMKESVDRKRKKNGRH